MRMLAKIHHYLLKDTPRTLTPPRTIIHTDDVGSHVLGQMNNSHINRLIKLQNKANRVINFAPFRWSETPLYKTSRILKFYDNIKLQNFLYELDCLKCCTNVFNTNVFTLVSW